MISNKKQTSSQAHHTSSFPAHSVPAHQDFGEDDCQQSHILPDVEYPLLDEQLLQKMKQELRELCEWKYPVKWNWNGWD
ncbi:MAG: hypothetical protein OXF60_06600 [Gammaproteobacteria bacterium]|nr:hypothetical protein [Gammaproteobacteria bacterium]MCY4219443.1 hypothetical protein [Gammaproteobacteria bacterium]